MNPCKLEFHNAKMLVFYKVIIWPKHAFTSAIIVANTLNLILMQSF